MNLLIANLNMQLLLQSPEYSKFNEYPIDITGKQKMKKIISKEIIILANHLIIIYN